jgi:hypothetical protein
MLLKFVLALFVTTGLALTILPSLDRHRLSPPRWSRRPARVWSCTAPAA